MKIKPEHYEVLKTAIENAYSHLKTLEEHEARGISAKGWRASLLYVADVQITDSQNAWVYEEDNTPFLPLYDYMNDDHIDTALRKITNTK